MNPVETIARASYGRLLARLATRTRNLAAAEDALGEALVAALEQWPRDAAPDHPEAWLVEVAKRRLVDEHRRKGVRTQAESHLLLLLQERTTEETSVQADRRLELMFACAHPAIEPQIRTPLMLQTILGFSAIQIGRAMRVAPKTVGQRLWRAKKKILASGIPFEIPEPHQRPERLHSVLEAIYAAFGQAGQDVTHADPHGLAEEARWLARLVVELMPSEPEARGLLALLLFVSSRHPAQRTPDEGKRTYVPLSQQDPTTWSQPLLQEAEAQLQRAAAHKTVGPFQLEAAIQSAHVAQVLGGRETGPAILALYEGLIALAPTLAAHVGRAAATLAIGRPEQGIAWLETLPADRVADYQPYFAVLAHLQSEAGHPGAAQTFQRAAGLTEDPAVRAYLLQQLRAAQP